VFILLYVGKIPISERRGGREKRKRKEEREGGEKLQNSSLMRYMDLVCNTIQISQV
jgi:hypothetical protein